MFCSLAQTLFCVLLINGGMYALHLNGNNGNPGSGSSSSSSGINNNHHDTFSHASAMSHQQSPLQQQQQQQATNRMLHALGNSLTHPQQQHHPPPAHYFQHQQLQLQPPHQQSHQPLQHQQQHTGGGGSGGSDGGGGLGIGLANPSHKSISEARLDATTGRLNQELADMAQLERERLMLLALAKQTAAAAAAAEAGGTGHHGRPIIAGRIQMHPTEDVDVGDYPAFLQQAARGFMFGNVVKQPPAPPVNVDTSAGATGDPDDDEYASARDAYGRRPVKYDYGRIVQPGERDEYDAQHGGSTFGDFDDFMELEGDADDEILADLDQYQYHGWEDSPVANVDPNPYHAFEEFENLNAPEPLQELLEEQRAESIAENKHSKPMHDQAHYANAKARGGAVLPGYNIRMQQKWAKKRAHANQPNAQTQYQRNIFGHHFGQQRNKLGLANSEATATATKHKMATNPAAAASAASGAAGSGVGSARSIAQSSSINSVAAKNDKSSAAVGTAEADKSTLNNEKDSSSTLQNQKQPQKQKQKDEDEAELLNPNHKRSGGIGLSVSASSSAAALGGASAGGAGAGGYMPSTSTHSLANQLMLRTARGQRQYDVPQIECPTAMDGMERFACPTPDLQGRYRCIDDHVLCDGFIDCPEGEDEDRRSCMFYKTTKAHLDVLADALLRWARGR